MENNLEILVCRHCIRKGVPEKLKENHKAAQKGIREALLC